MRGWLPLILLLVLLQHMWPPSGAIHWMVLIRHLLLLGVVNKDYVAGLGWVALPRPWT